VAAILFSATLLLWLLLTGSINPQELIAGLLVAAAATALGTPRAMVVGGLRLTPAAPLHLLKYLGVFLVALIKSNLDVARRVLAPSLPINPGVVQVRTQLQSDLGRLLLANSITLTPGTLTVDVEGDTLLIHWIDCPPGVDMEQATRLIAADFEKHLAGFVA
jgi:multicomponent Na+:H+ antiporter subunit E